MFEVLFWVTLALSITALVLVWLRLCNVTAERDAACQEAYVAETQARDAKLDAEKMAEIPVPQMPIPEPRVMVNPTAGEWGIIFPTGIHKERRTNSMGSTWNEYERVVYFTDAAEARADVEASEEEQNKLAIERYREECDQYERLCKAKAMRDQAGEES